MVAKLKIVSIMVGNSIIKLFEFYITFKRTGFLSWNLPHLPPFPSPLALASAISEPSSSDSQPKSKVPSAEHDDSPFYISLKIIIYGDVLATENTQNTSRALRNYQSYFWL